MTIPQEALDAAAAEIGRQMHGGPADPDDIKFASEVLAEAAPLIAAAERKRTGQLQDALARHQHKLIDRLGACCAGCLSDWPCPDASLLGGTP